MHGNGSINKKWFNLHFNKNKLACFENATFYFKTAVVATDFAMKRQ
jgi:hypothetical protein